MNVITLLSMVSITVDAYKSQKNQLSIHGPNAAYPVYP